VQIWYSPRVENRDATFEGLPYPPEGSTSGPSSIIQVPGCRHDSKRQGQHPPTLPRCKFRAYGRGAGVPPFMQHLLCFFDSKRNNISKRKIPKPWLQISVDQEIAVTTSRLEMRSLQRCYCRKQRPELLCPDTACLTYRLVQFLLSPRLSRGTLPSRLRRAVQAQQSWLVIWLTAARLI